MVTSFEQWKNSTACERSSMEEFRTYCCIHGYHVYKEMWEAAAGELLEKCWGVCDHTTFRIDTGFCPGFAEWFA